MYRYEIDGEERSEPEENMVWLDYLILSNPQGVMKVLAKYGYTGFLAPESQEEMYDACLDLMEKYDDRAVIDLLKSNILYDLIAETSRKESTEKNVYSNASGDNFPSIKTIDKKELMVLAEKALIIVGSFYVAGKILRYIKG